MRKFRSDEDDDDYFFPFGGSGHSITVYEVDRPGPIFTGILDARGNPMYRVVPPRPPIGFRCDSFAERLFDFDPEQDYFYVGSGDLEPGDRDLLDEAED